MWRITVKHTGKEEENSERQRGKERERPMWRKVKYPFFFFWDAVIPAGPCSLTRWLEEGGKKNGERGKEGEKAKAACEVAR